MDPKKKILIVDDDKDALRVFEAILTSGGYDVITASNGQQGISLAEKEQPHLIMLDIRMPGLDGLATTDLLKTTHATRSIPIVYLSSLVRPEQVEHGHVTGSRIGNLFFLSKGASSREILDVIAERISSR